MTDFLAIRQVERHSKYLGVPTLMVHSKKLVFNEMKDQIWKKLQGWKEKLVSCASREVLHKAIVQTVPTYLMSVYKVPVSVIQSIHSAMTRFFWGQPGAERKIHWKSWEFLCNPKYIGGMGFRDLGVFNEALLRR